MPNRKAVLTKKMLLTVTLLGVAVVGGLAAYVQFTPANKVPAAEHRDNVKKPLPAPEVSIHRSDPASKGKVFVFTPRYEGTNLLFDSAEVELPGDQEPAVFAVNEFLRASKITEESARLLSVDVQDNVATLSFNAAFRGGYGTDDEHTLLDGLRTTMGQFEAVEKIKILIDGEAVESLGSVELSELDVIRPSKQDGSSQTP